jgi:hypothetical protein
MDAPDDIFDLGGLAAKKGEHLRLLDDYLCRLDPTIPRDPMFREIVAFMKLSWEEYEEGWNNKTMDPVAATFMGQGMLRCIQEFWWKRKDEYPLGYADELYRMVTRALANAPQVEPPGPSTSDDDEK